MPAFGAATPQGKAFNRKRWWEQQYRIVQTNLREIDVLEDPREIARAIREFGANTIVSNIGGIVAFYPTRLELQYKNPYLKTDFVGEMIDAAHSEGLAYIGRFDLSKASKRVQEVHPDWFMVRRDGTTPNDFGMLSVCLNSGWAQGYGKEILAEAAQAYEADGFFFNMVGYPRGKDYSGTPRGICVCNNCRTRFRAMYGRDLPESDGFKDPNWISYLEFQDRTSAELTRSYHAILMKARPAATVTDFNQAEHVGRGEINRRIYRDAPDWSYAAGEQSRSVQARNPGIQFSAMSTAHVDYPWRQATETVFAHELRYGQLLGTGAKLDLYLMGTIADQDDQSWVPAVSRLFKWNAENAQSYEGLKPGARVALYISDKNDRYGGATPWGHYSTSAFRGAYSALVDSRIPFWFVSGERLEDGRSDLNDYDVVIMSHVMLLSEAEAKILDAFVAHGGLLISTGATGRFDPRGKPRARPILEATPVAAFGDAMDAHGWSLNDKGAALDYGAARIPVDGDYFGVIPAPQAANVIPFAPDQRFGPPEFSYALPGDRPRASPGVLVRQFGKGRAVHIPWLPEWTYYRDGLPAHQGLFAALVARYSPAPRFVLEGDGPVELLVMRQPAANATLLHVVNYAGQRNTHYGAPPPNDELVLKVLGPSPREARALVAASQLVGAPDQRDGRYTRFVLPPVRSFEAIRLA